MAKVGPGFVAVLPEGSEDAVFSRAADLSASLSLPLIQEKDEAYDLLLVVTDKRLELRLNKPHAPGSVYVDFLGGSLGYSRGINPFGQFIKAVCLQKTLPTVVDATAGLGHDAFLLANKGCKVTAIERSPVLAELLKDGIQRASADSELSEILQERFHLICADARDVLKEIQPDEAPEVITIDPMFPPKKKSALVKKEMRIVRRLVGDDTDSSELLNIARSAATSYVVVKRMLHAPVLAPNPSRTYRGKSTRYDVYQR